MSNLRFVFLCAFAICIAASAAEQPSGNADLPPGTMQNKARTACITCHDAHIIVQQRLSKTAWGKEVDKMNKWGAIVDPSDRDPLVDYFSTNFSPDKTPYIAQRSASRAH
jgi:hypothetical protein